MDQRIAVIAGASGAVGRHLLGYLLDSSTYSHVISLVRRPSVVASGKMTELVVNFNQLDRLTGLEGFNRVDDIYCCLGTTRKKAGSAQAFQKVDRDYVLMLGQLGKRLQAMRFTVISSIGAGGSATGLYLQTKTEMEQGLKSTGFSNLLIFRPSLLQGEREEFRPGEKLAALVMHPLSRVPLLSRYQPVTTIRLAKAMLQYTTSDEGSRGLQIIENRDIVKL